MPESSRPHSFVNRGGGNNLVLRHLVINLAGTQDLIAADPDQKFLEDWVYTPAVRRRTDDFG